MDGLRAPCQNLFATIDEGDKMGFEVSISLGVRRLERVSRWALTMTDGDLATIVRLLGSSRLRLTDSRGRAGATDSTPSAPSSS